VKVRQGILWGGKLLTGFAFVTDGAGL